MTKMVQVVEIFVDGGVQTTGTPQLEELSAVVEEASGFTQAAVVAAAAVPFADLTAAANKVNEILTALKNAGLMASA